MSAKHTPDWHSSLGFELVTATQANGLQICMVREHGDGATFQREATLAERVLWDTMQELLAALIALLADHDATANSEGWASSEEAEAARAAIARATGGAA